MHRYSQNQMLPIPVKRLNMYGLEMVTGRAARGPARAGPGPENPGPRASRAQTGLKNFYLRVLVQWKIQIFVDFLPNLLKIS